MLKAHELAKEQLTFGHDGQRGGRDRPRLAAASRGSTDAFTHSLGHGVGLLDPRAFPRLSPASEEVLSDGMVFSDEPGIYEAGAFGIRIEDTACLKEGRVRSFMRKTEHELSSFCKSINFR